MKVINRLYIFTSVIILIFIGYLYFSIVNIDSKMRINIEKILISKANYFSLNVEEKIKLKIDKNIYESLRDKPELRTWFEEALSISITPSFKYIYMLYRDKNGNFRYLIDASKEDKGEFDQKLNVDKEKWNRVYETKDVEVVFQNEIDTLLITYLKPIVFDDKVEAVLAIDFSTSMLSTIKKIILPIKEVFLYIFGAIILLFFILIYQVVLNIYTKKDSITDPLTSTYNRTFLRTFLKNIDMSKYQIAMLDIDYFKKINDNYGHKAGDYVLREIARTIKDTIRQKDLLVRFGGEEFIVFFLKEKHKKTDANDIACRIRKDIEKKEFKYENLSIRTTVSIGVVSNLEHFKSIHEAIKVADKRLYLAKQQGRNKVVVNSSESSNKNHLSISDVKEALDENRVICHYQPIINLFTTKVDKNEALVRIVTKDGTITYPDSFLDTIANTNVYNDITKRVLDIIFVQIKQHETSISINLNLSDILNTSIYEVVLNEIAQNKELAKWLTIELLEYEQIDEEILKDRLLNIKSFGVTIALDDFGTGYSNYSIFQTLPIDILKIDGSLIRDVDSSLTSQAIVESIVLFSKKIGIETVAEFIENKEILEAVKNLGVDKGQGYYISKPSSEIVTKTSYTS